MQPLKFFVFLIKNVSTYMPGTVSRSISMSLFKLHNHPEVGTALLYFTEKETEAREDGKQT